MDPINVTIKKRDIDQAPIVPGLLFSIVPSGTDFASTELISVRACDKTFLVNPYKMDAIGDGDLWHFPYDKAIDIQGKTVSEVKLLIKEIGKRTGYNVYAVTVSKIKSVNFEI